MICDFFFLNIMSYFRYKFINSAILHLKKQTKEKINYVQFFILRFENEAYDIANIQPCNFRLLQKVYY